LCRPKLDRVADLPFRRSRWRGDGWLAGADENLLPIHALVIRPGWAVLRWPIAAGGKLER
jgi:hypothetical protein